MKTLSLARPLLLVLVGLPGAGKSFFARQFSDMFGAPTVSFDRLHHELFEKPSLKPDEQKIIRRLADYQMEELVKTRRSFIIDGGSNTQTDRQRLGQLAKRHGYDTLVIWVQTDEATSRGRSTKPKPRPGEIALPAISIEQWTDASNRFYPPSRENHMVISGKHAFSTQAKMVLRKLSTPHAREADDMHQQKNQKNRTVHSRGAGQAASKQQRPGHKPVRRNVVIS